MYSTDLFPTLECFGLLLTLVSPAALQVSAVAVGGRVAGPELLTLGSTVNREYDIFQVLADGSLLWRATISGHSAATDKLQQLAMLESSEFRLIHLPDNTVIAKVNCSKAAGA